MANLFTLTAEMQELMDMMSDPDVDNQVIEDTLEGMQFELEQKAEQYCFVIRQFEADAEAFKREADKFSQKATICENNVKRLKARLMQAMALTGHEKGLDAGLFRLKIANNGGVRPVIYDGVVPTEFQKVKYENDTEKIRRYLDGLKEGETCDFAHYGERGQHLSMK